MTKLETFVLRLPTVQNYRNEGVSPSVQPYVIPGVEAIARSETARKELKVESLLLDDGERTEIATEAETVFTGISMPFTLIKPETGSASASAVDSWGIQAIDADALDETAGEGVKVAVLDTGIEKSHEAFDGLDPIIENFTTEDEKDLDGHGTHCAGTIFGQDVGGKRIGIARGVRKPLIGKVLGAGGGGSKQIMDAILWAQRNDADVISMSLGIDFTSFRDWLEARGHVSVEATSIALKAYRDNLRIFDILSRLFADGAGINTPLLIAASGNESRRSAYTIDTAPPAAADDILSVGALDQNNKIAPFSNTSPDCCAPGVGIVSAQLNGGLTAKSGTSMAAPHVAGVAVLEAARLRQGGHFTARQLREAVLSNATGVPGLSRLDGGAGKVMVRP